MGQDQHGDSTCGELQLSLQTHKIIIVITEDVADVQHDLRAALHEFASKCALWRKLDNEP